MSSRAKNPARCSPLTKRILGVMFGVVSEWLMKRVLLPLYSLGTRGGKSKVDIRCWCARRKKKPRGSSERMKKLTEVDHQIGCDLEQVAAVASIINLAASVGFLL
jgi:hypothetical protein